MKNPYFSVIIPTYNRCGFLKNSVESVLCQTEADFEIIIVDDGSTDETQSFIRTINDKRLVYIQQPHKGVSSARNLGISCSKAPHIAFLDSDDYFKPEKLEITRQYIDKAPNIKIFHTEEIWYRNKKLLNQKKIHKKPDGYVFDNSLHLCCISMSTSVVLKEVFKQVGDFDEDMKACEDYDLWLRVSAIYNFKLIPEVLTIKHGGHSDQLSQKYPAMDTLRIYAINKLLKNSTLTDKQRTLAINELTKKCLIYINGAEKRGKTKEVKHYTKLINSYKTQNLQEQSKHAH